MLAYRRRGSLLLASLFLLTMGLAEEAIAESDLPLPPGEIISGPIFRGNGTFVPETETGANANSYLFSVPPTESFTPSLRPPSWCAPQCRRNMYGPIPMASPAQLVASSPGRTPSGG